MWRSVLIKPDEAVIILSGIGERAPSTCEYKKEKVLLCL